MTWQTSEPFALVGDIGGTKTNLALFAEEDPRPAPIVIETYPSREASGLEEIVSAFLRAHPEPISSACFGMAGPVIGGVGKATNLPWVVHCRDLKQRFGWETVNLINDLAATALSIPVLDETESRVLNEGKLDPSGAVGLVAPGTGLGMCLALRIGGELHPLASEGSHADFAPRNELEIALLEHLRIRWDHVSVERLASGPGIFTIYSWLREYRKHPEPCVLTEKIRSEDPSMAVSEAAMRSEDPVCVEALELFVSILGAVSGNLALTGLTTGGFYLGGGIPPKILPKLEDETFMEAFVAKGRFKDLLSSIPVKVILNDRAALLGAAMCALRGSKAGHAPGHSHAAKICP